MGKRLVVAAMLLAGCDLTVDAGGDGGLGGGVGFEVPQDDCGGTSVGCTWKSNGVLDQMINLPAGTWVFVIERNPAGPFSLQLQ